MSDTIDLHAPEYTIPGDLDRRVEAWPDRTERRLRHLEHRVRHLEETLHRLLNQATEDESDL